MGNPDFSGYPRAWLVSPAAEPVTGSALHGLHGLPLSTYSPDFMSVEYLWQWVREDVTYHTCYDSREELIAQLEQFQQEINATPYAVADRLWVKTHLVLKRKNYG